jgi:hypothetical protein
MIVNITIRARLSSAIRTPSRAEIGITLEADARGRLAERHMPSAPGSLRQEPAAEPWGLTEADTLLLARRTASE